MSETLSIPEHALEDVIVVIRAGIEQTHDAVDELRYVQANTLAHLELWCEEMEQALHERGLVKQYRWAVNDGDRFAEGVVARELKDRLKKRW